MNTSNVGTPSLAYNEMAARWSLIIDLLGGTAEMRAARTKWLPMEPKEELVQYENRVARSFLFNGYRDGVRRIVAKPFSRPITLANATVLPEPLKLIEKDADRAGSTLTQFGSTCFRAGINYGVGHILVDYPRTGGTQSIQDEREQDLRPFFVHVPAPNLIGWRVSMDVDGAPVLEQVRIKEDRVEADGEFGERLVEYVREINRDGSWTLWRKADVESRGGVEAPYVEQTSGTLTYPGIPLVTWYTESDGFMLGTPAMEELAWTNLAHWQSYSDQRNCLRFARVGILFAKGISTQDIEEQTGGKQLVIGPQSFFRATNVDADMKYVEHSGAAIESGRKDLQDLEERMELLGMQPLVQRSGDQTATGKAIDESRTSTDAQSWIRSLEGALEQAYRIAGKWVGAELEEDFSVDIFNEWGIGSRAAQDLDLLLRACIAGKVTTRTFLNECRRRKVLDDSVDVEEELEQIEVQGPDISTFGTEDEMEGEEKEEGEEGEAEEASGDEGEELNAEA